MTDEQIDAIARELFFSPMEDKEGDWGPNSLNQLWCEDVGRPFARAVIASKDEQIRKLREALEAYLSADELAEGYGGGIGFGSLRALARATLKETE